ncbi:MAG TPA: hypothetical protein VE971_01195 [Candidatus Eisenbacteria bacterium]|nr:hypothetical protein [Candidatus Eisenbacteria bacterium]
MPLSLVAEAVRLVLVAKSVCLDLFANTEIPQLPAEIRSNNRAFSSAIVPTLFYFIIFQAEACVIKIDLLAMQVKDLGI